MRVSGIAPKPTAGNAAPVITAPTDSFVHAFAGRFAIIKPLVASGSVAGYYVTIKGASDYFKIDYTKQLITERKISKTNRLHNKHAGFGLRPNGTQGDSFVDSAIVLILPPNIHLPDTICVTYAAYDYSGNVSGSVTSCVIISKLGGDANTSWLQGGWRFIYDYETGPTGANGVYHTVPYNKWIDINDINNSFIDVVDSVNYYYYCNTISPGVTQVSLTYIDSIKSKRILYYGDSNYILKIDVLFNNNGGLSLLKSHKESRIDSTNSNCDQLKYFTTTYDQKQTGGWSITGDKITLVIEFDQNGAPDYEVWEYTLKKISDAEIRMFDPIETGYKSYQDFIKL